MPPAAANRVLLNEGGFPAELGSMPQPVKALWYVGRLPAATDRRLAVVGARGASTAKSRLAHYLSASAVRDGFAVVSGGALGIDAATQDKLEVAVKEFLLGQLAHLANTDATTQVAKKLKV